MKKNNFAIRLLVTILGMIIIGFGVGLYIYVDLGVDAASVLMTGIQKIFDISYGVASFGLNVILIIIIFFIDKKYLNISTFLAIFTIGFSVDLSVSIYSKFISVNNIYLNWFLCVLGCFIMAFGVALYIYTKLGVGAIDCVSEIISDRFNKPYKYVRIGADFCFLILGLFVGGSFGLGTIVISLLTGPFVSISRDILNLVIGNRLN